MIAWRLAKKKRARDLTGKGAAIEGGRWNNENVPVLYLGMSAGICCLERYVHAAGPPDYPMVMTRFLLPDDASLYWEPSVSELPDGWNSLPADTSSMDFGSQWAESGKSLGLIVPSVIVPMESNIVINPHHPAAHQIKIDKMVDFVFDGRLLELLKPTE